MRLHRLRLPELVVLFLALNLVDVLLTCWLLTQSGMVEANPLLSGRDSWASMKMGMAATCALFVVLWDRPRIMRALVVGMLGIVGWNLAMAGVALW